MAIAEILPEDMILLDPDCTEKSAVISALLARAVASGALASPEEAERILTEREGKQSTLLTRDLALPHARVPGLTRSLCGWTRLARPVLWDEETGATARLVVLLLSPLANHGEHLRLLAALARLLKDARTAEALLTAGSPAELLERMRRYESARVL